MLQFEENLFINNNFITELEDGLTVEKKRKDDKYLISLKFYDVSYLNLKDLAYPVDLVIQTFNAKQIIKDFKVSQIDFEENIISGYCTNVSLKEIEENELKFYTELKDYQLKKREYELKEESLLLKNKKENNVINTNYVVKSISAEEIISILNKKNNE